MAIVPEGVHSTMSSPTKDEGAGSVSGQAGGSAAGIGVILTKDLAVLSVRGFLAVLGVFLLAAVQTVTVEEVYFILGLALACALSAYVPAVEWFQETNPMLHSLPVRRATVVLARYLASVGAALVALGAWVSAGWIFRPLLAPEQTAPAMWMTVEGLLTYGVAFAVLAALFFPLYFRFGFARGGFAFLGGLPLLMLIGYGTAGVAWGPNVATIGVAGAAPGGAGVVLPSTLLSSRVSALVAGIGPGWALAAILVGIGGILAFSERLSVRWYGRREF